MEIAERGFVFHFSDLSFKDQGRRKVWYIPWFTAIWGRTWIATLMQTWRPLFCWLCLRVGGHKPKGCFLSSMVGAWKSMILSGDPEKMWSYFRSRTLFAAMGMKVKSSSNSVFVWCCLYFRSASLPFTKWYKGFLSKIGGEWTGDIEIASEDKFGT